jgi:peptidoglycan/LPS O-acetylase OafA/YrhL
VTDQPTPRAVDRLPALDGIRIVAATGVLLVHVGGSSGWTFFKSWGGVFEEMSVGVAIFFLLSGFVVFQPWLQAAVRGADAPATGRFLVRRFARIVPACWVVVAVCLIVLADGGTVQQWIRHLTFTQIYTWRAFGPALGQTWTLCVELTFYLVLPAFAALVVPRAAGQRWRPVRTATLIAAITVPITGVWLVLLDTGVLKLYLHHMWLPAYAMWFGAGMLLATAHVALQAGSAPRAWRVLDRIGAHPWLCWTLAAAGIAAGSTGIAGPLGLDPYTGSQFSVRLVLHLAIALLVLVPLVFGPPTRLRAIVGSRPLRWLGGSLSYGVYLWHPFVIAMVFRATGWPDLSGHLFKLFALTMLGALALAAASYYLIERPVVRLASRFPGGRRPALADRPPVPSASAADA